MAKPKSIYLTDESMRSVRAGDALSARINQIIERYSLILSEEVADLKDKIVSSEVLDAIAVHWRPSQVPPRFQDQLSLALSIASEVAPQWVSRLRDLDEIQHIALLEAIEARALA